MTRSLWVIDDDASTELMNRWLGTGMERSEQRLGVHRIAEVLRAAAAELVQVDAEAATVADLLAAEDLAGRLRHALATLPQFDTTPALAPLPGSYLFERSPITGATNPVAAPLRIRYGVPTTAQVVYTEQYEGPAGGVHGGIVAGAFDEVLGVAQMAAGIAGYTGTLEVRYRAVTPLHTVVTYEAGVDRVEDRKVYMKATSTADGRLTAEASAVFIAMAHLPMPEPGTS